MSQNRKLLDEISRTLKKVTEGIELFDEIWEKVHAAPNQAQKEKFEAELKKEIKKLQRLRDNIKGWQSSSEIKDKSGLIDARKQIENKMEQFRFCEKETKTKAYSIQGLAKMPKQDPEAAAKYHTESWLVQAIDELKRQIETFEADIELASKKGGKKKAAERLEECVTRHKDHIRHLECILRMVDNDILMPQQVDEIQEGVEHYTQSNQDPEFEEMPGLYDELVDDSMLDDHDDDDSGSEASSQKADLPTTPQLTALSGPPVPPMAEKVKAKPAAVPAPVVEKKKPPAAIPAPGTPTGGPAAATTPPPTLAPSPTAPPAGGKVVPGAPVPQVVQPKPKVKQAPPTPPPAAPAPVVKAPPAPPVKPAPPSKPAPAAAPVAAATTPTQAQQPARQPPAPTTVAATSPVTTPTAKPVPPPQQPLPKQAPRGATPPQAINDQTLKSMVENKGNPDPANNGNTSPSTSRLSSWAARAAAAAAGPGGAPAQQAPPSKALERPAPAALDQLGDGVDLEEEDENNDETFGDDVGPVGVGTLEELSMQTAKLQKELQGDAAPPPRPSYAQAASYGAEHHLPASPTATAEPSPTLPLPASSPAPASPLSPTGSFAVGTEAFNRNVALNMLESSLKTLPKAHDCERRKPYTPPNPHPTPAYYPQAPHPVFDTPEIFSKFDTDTLYFIFYYQQATYQQYLAAKELKKQSWRYHKKYMTWFQRHDQPKVTTDEFEQGTYVYFDYETGWCQRLKHEFTFKYAYLEDELPL